MTFLKIVKMVYFNKTLKRPHFLIQTDFMYKKLKEKPTLKKKTKNMNPSKKRSKIHLHNITLKDCCYFFHKIHHPKRLLSIKIKNYSPKWKKEIFYLEFGEGDVVSFVESALSCPGCAWLAAPPPVNLACKNKF